MQPGGHNTESHDGQVQGAGDPTQEVNLQKETSQEIPTFSVFSEKSFMKNTTGIVQTVSHWLHPRDDYSTTEM